jgi:predicted CoA-binding protein
MTTNQDQDHLPERNAAPARAPQPGPRPAQSTKLAAAEPSAAQPPTAQAPVAHAPAAQAPVARPDLAVMLEARSVAIVGASPRPGAFGQRMIEEVTKSPSRPEIFLVNPKYTKIAGQRCVPSLADLPAPVDLVLLGVPDAALEQQLTLAAQHGDRSAVIFGNAYEPPPGHPPKSPGAPNPPDSSPWMNRWAAKSPPNG